MSKRRFTALTAVVVMVMVALPALADMKIVAHQKTGAMIGQPAKDEKVTTYITDENIRMDVSKELYALYNFKSDEFYYVFPKRKQYSLVEWEKIQPMLDMAMGMMGDMKIDAKKTGKKKKVDKWDTEIWKLTMSSNMFSMDMTIYLAPSIKTPKSLDKFMESFMKMSGPMAAVFDKMKNMKGYPVLNVIKISIMGNETDMTQKVVSITEEKIPATIFEIPKKYRKIPFDLQALQQR